VELFVDVAVSVVFLIAGPFSIAHSIRGKEFHFARLGSDRPGPRMPTWFGRLFFFIFGVGAIALGIGFLVQEFGKPHA
jgi:hypothetical protein